jgi:3-deoxy-D-manno-octulosonic-acid transferase
MVERFLDRVQPDLVALCELEVWPNFVDACTRRKIPVTVVNGRLSERSYGRYVMLKALFAPTFGKLDAVFAQNQEYAGRFLGLGAEEGRVYVTGTMKWDTAQIADAVPGADDFAEAMGIDRRVPLVVAGSTAPEEHRLLREAVPKGVQLLCAPRKPEWFDAAAADRQIGGQQPPGITQWLGCGLVIDPAASDIDRDARRDGQAVPGSRGEAAAGDTDIGVNQN